MHPAQLHSSSCDGVGAERTMRLHLMRTRRLATKLRCAVFSASCLALFGVSATMGSGAAHGADYSADREQGLPLIHGHLPSEFYSPSAPVGPQAFTIEQMGDGAIVVANNFGLLRLNGASWRTWNPLNGSVLSLAGGANGRVYLGGTGDFGYFDAFGSKFVSLAAAAQGRTLGDFWVTVAAADGSVYFADQKQAFRWNGSALSVAYEGGQDIWRGTRFAGGVALFDRGAGLIAVTPSGAERLADSEALSKQGDCAIASVPEGMVTACSEGDIRLWRESGGNLALARSREMHELLRKAGVSSIALLDSGGFVIGTQRDGLLLIDADGASRGHLSDIPQWGSTRVFSILPRGAEGLWVGLDYGLYFVEWPGQVSKFESAQGLPRLALDVVRSQGALFVGCKNGIFRLRPKSDDQVLASFEPYALNQASLFRIAAADATLFAGTRSGVYAVVDGVAERLDARLAYVVFPLDEFGTRVLAGGENGARILSKRSGVWSAVEIPDLNVEIRRAYRDRSGALWLAGNHPGVYRISELQGAFSVRRYGEAEGLPPGRISPVDFPDAMALATPRGLYRFDAATERFFPDANLLALLAPESGEVRRTAVLDAQSVLVSQYDRLRLIRRDAQGHWAEEITPLGRMPRGLLLNGLLVETDATVWVASNEALFRHHPATQSRLPDLPQPRALFEHGDGRLVSLAQSVAPLNMGTAPQTLAFRFELPFFVGEEQLRFRSRLHPLEEQWTRWSESPRRELTHTPSGDFTLEVQASDTFGRISKTLGVALHLEQPWYQRWWAIALYAAAAALLLAIVVQRRERQLLMRAKELEALVRDRTRALEEASITDQLTGLRNRRYFETAIKRVWTGNCKGVLVLLADIDHFKKINDEYGHDGGDLVLKAVAQRLAATMRPSAVVFRWGGEEFLILAALSEPSESVVIATGLLHCVGDMAVPLSTERNVPVTCSIGWQVVTEVDHNALNDALRSADAHLYKAKRSGRDRAVGAALVPGARLYETEGTAATGEPLLTLRRTG